MATEPVTDAAAPAAAPAAAAQDHPAAGPGQLAAAFHPHTLSLASRAVHADDYINTHRAVAPPLHVSTTYRYSRDPVALRQWENHDPNAPFDSHIYARDSAPNTTRLEAVLTALLGAPSLTYASGLAAFHALIVFLNPRRVAIDVGYHGCHGVLALMHKVNGLQKLDLASEADVAQLRPGDVVHVETPLNPTGEARDLAYYARLAHDRGCYLTVDATFGPPPLQDPFAWGADVVLHSGTKYFGGHSDMLCGVLAVNPAHTYVVDHAATDAATAVTPAAAAAAATDDPTKKDWIAGLRSERLLLGSVMGSLEGWLGVRSLRTLELRVTRQSTNAAHLVAWLAAASAQPGTLVARIVERVHHASLQPEAADPDSWLRKQMPRGFGPVFAIVLRDEHLARRLPSKLELFHHATSLGGVESLIEWRYMTDRSVDRRLLRISVGVEGWEDLKADLKRAFAALAAGIDDTAAATAGAVAADSATNGKAARGPVPA
ncbi:cystathionine gamma-synthase [Niveomyces insectorum RCEF 264]|uniref:Cystathionine gamma-synthase n=1 Tax=Niveomyces insectorum RCEF 264 TaxID=1081102 RepID=A0A167WXX1_9HYPO|nr:cystathionine gamma-synthase [Niveomyces insectorum RCEF 264]